MIQSDKSTLMTLVTAGLSHECFEHSIHGHFDVTLMREAIRLGTIPYETVQTPVDYLVKHIKESRVVEESRWMHLPFKSWYDDPGIAVITPDDQGGIWTIMIDGHHRAMRRQFECKELMVLHLVPLEAAIRPAPSLRQIADWGDPMVNGKIIRRTA